MADASQLNASAIEAKRILQAAFHRPIVALLLHVDEIDDDEARKIAQLELAGNLVGGFEVGVECRLLDRELARGFTGVDVDGDQRLGLVDDQVAAGLEGHVRVEHGVELALDAVLGEQRLGILMHDDVLGMARHEHAHEVLGILVGVLAGDDDLFHVLVVKVADGALDQVAFLVDEARRRALEGEIAHALPQAQQVFEVAPDLLLGAGGASRADDEPHAFRHLELGSDGLETLPVLRAA